MNGNEFPYQVHHTPTLSQGDVCIQGMRNTFCATSNPWRVVVQQQTLLHRNEDNLIHP
jgi:hypothetical protein